ncbi:hypothetical protein BV22DRAFT_832692 [Leucogyrophana mollusca]|uniref:Uncharacterized protein n=1 Tax=Leucogyrophana mollusca TaxID=85980 RepID=A0ACB8B451_9AGAM|nr:hypothetical protein BV22DRAFT_832692 [Leucogyrophana mollusca]
MALFRLPIGYFTPEHQVQHLRSARGSDPRAEAYSLDNFGTFGLMFPASRAAAESLAIRAVNLEHETDCSEILPCALYYCSRLHIPTIVRGTSEVLLLKDDINACVIGRDLPPKKQREDPTRPCTPRPGRPSPRRYPSGCSKPVTCAKGENPGAVLECVNGVDTLTPMALEAFADWQKIGCCAACAD